MILRALTGQVPELLFTKDYKEFLHGTLTRGGLVRVNYDAERLPQIFDHPGSRIEARGVFHPGATPRSFPLESQTGTLTRKAGIEPGAGSMVTGLIRVPPDAEQFELWFTLSLSDRILAYDSDHSKNFNFPFLDNDVRVREASITPIAGKTTDQLHVVVECADGVSGVELDYRVTNVAHVSVSPTHVPLERRTLLPDGWHIWLSQNVEVPHGAVVSFSVTYRRATKTYFDDNHHRGYLAAP